MKLTEKDKKELQILLILLILGLSIFNFFYTNNDKFSIKAINEKEISLDSTNNAINKNEITIENKKIELSNLNVSVEEEQQNLNDLKSYINNEDLKFHMPSLLISLEQNALKNNLKIFIEYNKIKNFISDKKTVIDELKKGTDTSGINNPIIEGVVERVETTKASSTDIVATKGFSNEEISNEEVPEINNSINIVSNEEVLTEDNSTAETKVSQTDEIIESYKAPTIKGINTTTIPIKVEGDYSDLREFIKYLDELDYIEPGVMKIESDGKNITGFIILNVFHGEVG